VIKITESLGNDCKQTEVLVQRISWN